MKNKKPDAALVWKQLEDSLIPRLALSVADRAVYSHLLRHSWLEGKPRIRFSLLWLSRGSRLSRGPARNALRRLVARGALRLLERSRVGHFIEVRLPAEIPTARSKWRGARPSVELNRVHILPTDLDPTDLEKTDFLQTRALRQTIHNRERRRCFYCLRRLNNRTHCLDHVRPRAQSGGNSYRNLVSCCMDCNTRKGETPASDFLRWLYREGRLTAAELTSRLRALAALAAGKLRPVLPLPSPPDSRNGIELM